MVELDEGASDVKVHFPDVVPVIALKGMTVFPLMVAPLATGGEVENLTVDRALAGQRMVALLTLKPGAEVPTPEGLYEIGTVGVIQKMIQMPDQSRRLLVRALARVRVLGFEETEPVLMARVERVQEDEPRDPHSEAVRDSLVKTFGRIVELSPYLPEEAFIQALNVDNASTLCDLIAAALPLGPQEQQAVLSTVDVDRRLELVTALAHGTLAKLEVADKVGTDAREAIEKGQREYMLREQLRAIRKELGEEDDGQEIEDLRRRLQEADLPEAARKAADRELGRLEKMNPAAAEHSVVRTYLEWMAELPWSVSSEDHLDVAAAQQVLDEDHYGLEEVKDRIVEYLAVRKIKADMKGPILCFVGPPGVGKTSLGRSIARAMNRKFVRMSLGGVHDEAEIRGHRRTYVGALPGRVIRALRDAGTNNPVLMLDEVDKIGADFRGDPSSALLEVLDPAQNFSFSDHYLEVPFDLSKVLFICTANILQTIPPPLLDRMEVIPLAGYTDEDKVHIAKRYLIPRQREEHGLRPRQARLSDAALRAIIARYTREAGVRNLERQIGTVCRKLARKVAEGETKLPAVGPGNLQDFLGRPRLFPDACETVTQPGVVTGLAWTQSGGEILFVEATRMKGKGSLRLTGQLGDVMEESAQAALSYVRANAERLGVDEDLFEKSDLHIHVPGGAVPKDGPSAGVAMVTALVSLLTGRLASCGVAMTGEITLRGRVLPIGGVKEKSLAARRAGLKTVILPARNEPDVSELPEDLKKDLRFVFADRIEDVLTAALQNGA